MKSTSVVYRIHQLGHDLERERTARIAAEQERDKFKHAWEDLHRVLAACNDARGLLEADLAATRTALEPLRELIAKRKNADGKWKALGDPELAYAVAAALARSGDAANSDAQSQSR